MGRAPCCEKVGVKRGRWTAEEDDTLASYIAEHGEGSWRSLPKNAGLLRCGKSCRLRWINYLRDGVKRGNISKEEDDLIVKLHATLGNRWSLIASHLPGRTDNEIKNYWNSHLSRQIHTFRRTYAAGRDTTITIDISKLSAAGKQSGGRTAGRSPKSKQPGQQDPTTAKVDAKEQHSTSPASSPRQSDGARSTVVDPDQNQPNGTASISHTPGGPCSEDATGPMVMDDIDKTGLLDTIGGPDHIGLWEAYSPIYEFGLLGSESEMDTLICRGVRPETELFTGVEAQVDDLLDMDWEGLGAHLWDEPAQNDLSRGTEPQAATTGSDSDELESFVSWLLSDAC